MDQKLLENIVARAPKTMKLGELEPQILALGVDNRAFFINMANFLRPDHFDNPTNGQVWGWMTRYYHEKHMIPTRAVIEVAFSNVDVHFHLPIVDVRAAPFVSEEAYRIVQRQQLDQFTIRLLLESSGDSIDFEGLHKQLLKVVNIRDNGGTGFLNYFDVENRYARLGHFWDGRISTGFQTLDLLLPGGGLGKKEMMCILGPPGSGKCTVSQTPVEAEIIIDNETMRLSCSVGFIVKLKAMIRNCEIRVSSESGYRKVEHAWLTQPNPEWYLETENGKTLFCADDHRVQTENGFEFVQRLKQGDSVVTVDGLSKVVVARSTGRTLPMVDLQMEGHHYFTNGILSHNTTWLINIAARMISNGHQVLHITREVSEDIVGLRYDCCLLSATPNELLGDRPATIDRIKRLRAGLGLGSPLFIREYPTGGTTIAQCRADYQMLRETENFTAAAVVDDYPDLAKPSRYRDNDYSEAGLTFAEFRGWMVEDEIAGLVGTQATRTAEDLHGDMMIQMKHTADSYNKPRLVDEMFTINESAEDRVTGHQKLFVAKSRNEKSHVWGKFKVDKARMRISDTFQSSYDQSARSAT